MTLNNLNQRLNSKLHVFIRVIIPISLVMAISMPSVVNAAYVQMNNTHHIPMVPLVFPSANGYNFLQDYKTQNGVQFNSVSASTPMAIAIFKSQAKTTGTLPIVGGTGTRCTYETYTVYVGSHMRWRTDSTGKHILERTIGYESDGTTPLSNWSNTTVATEGDAANYRGGHWPYLWDPVPASRGAMQMNKTVIVPFSVTPATAGVDQATCNTETGNTAANHFGMGRFSGTTMSTMGWTTVIDSFQETKPSYDNGGGFTEIVAAENVTYDSSYTGRKYNMGVGQLQEASNSLLEDGCANDLNPLEGLICKLQAVIGDTISSIWRGILWLIVPDQAALAIMFDDESDYWSEKLGILAYPITILVSVFGEMQDTGNFTGCSETSCVKTFGTFYDSNVSIDFSAMNKLSAPVWQFMLFMLRLGAVWALIITIKWQYWRMLHRSSM